MNSIDSVTASHPSPPPLTGSGSRATTTPATTSKAADIVASRATAQLTADDKAKSAISAVISAQQAGDNADTATHKAEGLVQVNEHQTSSVNIMV